MVSGCRGLGGTCRPHIYFSVLGISYSKSNKHLFDVRNVIETAVPKK